MPKCLVGCTIGRPVAPEDLEILRLGRVEALKAPHYVSVPKDYFAVHQICVRPAHDDKIYNAQEYANKIRESVTKTYNEGGRWFELCAYPNSTNYGYGWAWKDGHEFSAYFIDVLGNLSQTLKEAKWGFPAVETGQEIGSCREDSEKFLREAHAAIGAADFISELVVFKSGERNREDFYQGLWRISDHLWRFGKPMVVEFYNPSAIISKEVKARQYIDFWEDMTRHTDVVAAFCSVLSSANPACKWMVWRGELGRISAIPRLVGGRTF